MKITLKDCIGYLIGLLGCVIGIIGLTLVSENRQLKNNAQYIHNSAQTIQQYIYNTNYNFPEPVKNEIENIAKATADMVSNKVFNKK